MEVRRNYKIGRGMLKTRIARILSSDRNKKRPNIGLRIGEKMGKRETRLVKPGKITRKNRGKNTKRKRIRMRGGSSFEHPTQGEHVSFKGDAS